MLHLLQVAKLLVGGNLLSSMSSKSILNHKDNMTLGVIITEDTFLTNSKTFQEDSHHTTPAPVGSYALVVGWTNLVSLFSDQKSLETSSRTPQKDVTN